MSALLKALSSRLSPSHPTQSTEKSMLSSALPSSSLLPKALQSSRKRTVSPVCSLETVSAVPSLSLAMTRTRSKESSLSLGSLGFSRTASGASTVCAYALSFEAPLTSCSFYEDVMSDEDDEKLGLGSAAESDFNLGLTDAARSLRRLASIDCLSHTDKKEKKATLHKCESSSSFSSTSSATSNSSTISLASTTSTASTNSTFIAITLNDQPTPLIIADTQPTLLLSTTRQLRKVVRTFVPSRKITPIDRKTATLELQREVEEIRELARVQKKTKELMEEYGMVKVREEKKRRSRSTLHCPKKAWAEDEAKRARGRPMRSTRSQVTEKKRGTWDKVEKWIRMI